MSELVWPAGFEEFTAPTKSILDQMTNAGWTIDTVVCGMSLRLPDSTDGSSPVERPAVEITAQSYSGRRVRIVGIAFRSGPGWSVARTSRPMGTGKNNIKHPYAVDDHEEIVRSVDEAFAAVSTPYMDVTQFFGDPSAFLSVFAIAGAFITGIASKAGDDAYTALKQAISRARRSTSMAPDDRSDWVVLHDVEYNTVIECPAELPAEAAVQLARKPREELTRVHLRWNLELRAWTVVGRIEGNPPAPNEGGPPPQQP